MPEASVSMDGGLVPIDPATTSDAAQAAGEEQIERIAGELYNIASMLLGEGEEAVGLIEQDIAGPGFAGEGDYNQLRHASRLLIAAQAIEILSGREAAALAAPELDQDGPVSCIEGDELDAAGVTSAELEAMLTGPDNESLRSWIEGLAAPLRVTFVLRAVAGLTSPEIAGLLAENGGPAAENWTPEAVRTIFRQALCSLAAQLLHATAER